ncbi:MAG: polyprenyl synthetase family protein [Bacteroidales bacterium]|nr:polyprenyl synthetase family protein [Bacteroidales bacterium]
MLTSQQYLDIVNRALGEIEYPAWLPGLYEPIKYTMEGGGKRLRPVLLLAVNDAFGGEIDQCIWPAVGVELFHNFTLVHDDVMDHADMRRGRETVFRRWDLNTAILSGDAMVSMAYKCVSGCPPMFLPEVIDRFGVMTMKVYEGQQMDADFELAQRVSFNEYISMIIAKTSALIAYPCSIGALIAGAQPDEIEAIFNFGTSLGIAFQMMDDYLDVYGDPKTFGKEIGGDILNDKKTWLYIIAQDQDKDSAFENARKLDGKEKIEAVTAVYDNLKLREYGDRLISKYTDDAIAYLNETSISEAGKQWLTDFAHNLLHRNK